MREKLDGPIANASFLLPLASFHPHHAPPTPLKRSPSESPKAGEKLIFVLPPKTIRVLFLEPSEVEVSMKRTQLLDEAVLGAAQGLLVCATSKRPALESLYL